MEEATLEGAIRWCLGAVEDWDWERGIRTADWPRTVAGAVRKLTDILWAEGERSAYSWCSDRARREAGLCYEASEDELQAAIERVLKEGRDGDPEPDKGA